jgi:hypothetical protein
MGSFNNLASIEIEGHSIEIEARSGFWDHQYSLVVNGIKQDQIKGFIGHFYLRGQLEVNSENKPFRVKIKQGLGTWFSVEYEGKHLTPNKIY